MTTPGKLLVGTWKSGGFLVSITLTEYLLVVCDLDANVHSQWKPGTKTGFLAQSRLNHVILPPEEWR